MKTNYLKQYQQARHSDQLKTAFLANMSHEIRTPLNAIVGFSTLISDGRFEEDQRREFQKLINSNSEYLLYLIEDIIDLSKLEAGSLVLNHQIIDLHVLFERLKCNLTKTLDNNVKNKLILDFELDLPENKIMTDPIRLEQILRNLIGNAIKFTSEGSVIFGCRIENRTHTFYIKDTGIGIRKENLVKIFERFVKIEEDHNCLSRGTGIGLFLSKHLVEKLGGTIWVESEHLKGASFYFTLKDYRVDQFRKYATVKTFPFPSNQI